MGLKWDGMCGGVGWVPKQLWVAGTRRESLFSYLVLLLRGDAALPAESAPRPPSCPPSPLSRILLPRHDDLGSPASLCRGGDGAHVPGQLRTHSHRQRDQLLRLRRPCRASSGDEQGQGTRS